MKIGNLTIQGPALLAPMAGVADRAFREMCVRFGAAYTMSEMVSAKGLQYHDKKPRRSWSLAPPSAPRESSCLATNPP